MTDVDCFGNADVTFAIQLDCCSATFSLAACTFGLGVCVSVAVAVGAIGIVFCRVCSLTALEDIGVRGTDGVEALVAAALVVNKV